MGNIITIKLKEARLTEIKDISLTPKDKSKDNDKGNNSTHNRTHHIMTKHFLDGAEVGSA